MKILVTGAAGQLGRVVAETWAPHHEIVPLTRADLDVTEHAAVLDRLLNVHPHAIVNCAAYNNVDGAEDEPATALDVNAFAVRSLAAAAARVGATLVHYSTDFVFDGESSRPYTEDDPANPQSTYAASKLLGEWFAKGAPKVYVLRIESLFGGPAAKSSIDRIADALIEDREARVFTDRVVSPSYVADVAWASRALLEGGAEPGLYHCVNTGYCTWHELAIRIAEELGLDGRANLIPISVAEVPLRAQRPKFAALSNEKLARIGVPMPTWQDALSRYLRKRRISR